MIKHWAKLSCLVACTQILAIACVTENDDDDGDNTTTSSTTTTTAGGGTGGTPGTGGNGGSGTTASGGSAGEATTSPSTTSSGGTAGGAGDGNEAGSAGAAGASTEGYDGGQITDISGPESVTNGGTFTIQVTIPGADDDQTFSVAVSGSDTVTTTSTPNDDGVFDLNVTLADDIEGESVTVTVSPVDGDGDVGDPAEIDFDLIESGTGDVKVTLSFDQSTDLDLMVMEPDGTVISYSAKVSPSGGTLDLDSNPECVVDGTNIENIFWPTDSAPEGEYGVAVFYYQACVQETVNYTVTINVGGDIETVTGSFEATVAGDEEAGFREVATFTVD